MLKFQRHPNNPLLIPISEHDWEDMAVFNPGATIYQDKVLLLYRAIDEYQNYISAVGLAVSENGLSFKRRAEPVLVPEKDYERFGIEDVRINQVEGQYYLTHTALGCPAPQGGEPHRVGLIKTNDFQTFERLGMVTAPEFCSRNGVLFPEKIAGRYAMMHRPLYLTQEKHPDREDYPNRPGVWVSYSTDLLNWSDHHLLIEPHFWWEGAKIGNGPPPVRTPRGWLVIYHGMDENRVYRAGLLLLDLADPKKILFRSPEPVLEPKADYEKLGDVPNVVFPTGLVEREDLFYLYYGAADTTVCLATASKAELLSRIPNS